MSDKRYVLLIYVVLALAAFITFRQVVHFEFLNYDDSDYVTQNEFVKAGLTRSSIIWAFTTGAAGNWHPLTWLSHMSDCQTFGADAGGHHMMSLLLHIINTLLLFSLLKQMSHTLWRSFFVAAAFALHPLHIESVAWIAERKDVLSTLFWMLTLTAYLRYVKQPCLSRYLLTLLAFVMGLMTKPMLVTLPLVMLLLDYWPLERFKNKRGLHLLREKIPFFIFSIISSIITFIVQQSGGAVKTFQMFPLKIRIANALISYLTYIEKMLWPSRLAVFYPYNVNALVTWRTLAAALVLLGISVCVIRLARTHKYLAVGWLWYIITLVPVIGLVQVGEHAFADRYTYVPLTGLFVMIAWGIPELITKWRYRKILLAVSMLLVLSALAICTRLQLPYWQNSITVFEHSIDVTESNHLAHYNLAQALTNKGRTDEAIIHFKEVLQLKPDRPDPMDMLAWLMATHKESRFHNPEEAIRLAEQSCKITA